MKTSSTSGQTEPINGLQMHYEIHGQGVPLVLLHGFTGSGVDWELVLTPASLPSPLLRKADLLERLSRRAVLLLLCRISQGKEPHDPD